MFDPAASVRPHLRSRRVFTRTSCFAALLLVGVAAQAEAQTRTLDRIAGWRSYFTEFSGGAVCGVSTATRDGSSIHLTRSADDPGVFMQVFNEGWRSVREGQSYALELLFDDGRGRAFEASALGVRSEMLSGVNFAIDLEGLRAFERARSLAIGLRDRRGGLRPLTQLDLRGSSRALRALLDCVRGPLAAFGGPRAPRAPFDDDDRPAAPGARAPEAPPGPDRPPRAVSPDVGGELIPI